MDLPHLISISKYVRTPRHFPGSPNSVALTTNLSQICFPSQSGNILSKTFFMPHVRVRFPYLSCFFSSELGSHIIFSALPYLAFIISITWSFFSQLTNFEISCPSQANLHSISLASKKVFQFQLRNGLLKTLISINFGLKA